MKFGIKPPSQISGNITEMFDEPIVYLQMPFPQGDVGVSVSINPKLFTYDYYINNANDIPYMSDDLLVKLFHGVQLEHIKLLRKIMKESELLLID